MNFVANKYMRLRSWPVKVSTLAASKIEMLESHDYIYLFVSSSYDDDHILCSFDKIQKSKYVISGNPKHVAMAAMIIDSFAGDSQLHSKRDGVINTKTLSDILMPAVDIEVMSSGAILELLILLSKKEMENTAVSKDQFQRLSVLLSFLLLIRNYYVEELYIPDEYAKRKVSVVKGWEEIVNFLPDPDPNQPDILIDLLMVFDCLLKHGNNLIEAFNKMKVFQIETSFLLQQRLASLRQ